MRNLVSAKSFRYLARSQVRLRQALLVAWFELRDLLMNYLCLCRDALARRQGDLTTQYLAEVFQGELPS